MEPKRPGRPPKLSSTTTEDETVVESSKRPVGRPRKKPLESTRYIEHQPLRPPNVSVLTGCWFL
jgi:hypothetical protein